MNVLGALLKRLSFRRAPHVWLAVIGIICHLGISIFAPMFQPDEGDIKRLVYSFRIIVVAVYILADLCVLAYKWLKVRNINRLLHSGQPYVIESQSSMRKDALGVCNFPYKTFIHLVSAFVLFAAEDNLFQSVIGVLQFYLPHLSSTNWAGTAVGVFINMGFFFLTFVVNMSSQYLAECIRNQRHVLVKDIHKDTEPQAVAFESLQVLDIMKIKANEKTTMGSFALCGHGLVNMRLANGENKDKPFQSLLGNSKLEASAALATFCAKLKLGWVLSVWKEHSANLIIHEDAHEKMVLQPSHFLPAGTICLQDTYVVAAPMWDKRSQVVHKVTMAERYSRVCMSFMIKLAALCVTVRTLLLHYTAKSDADQPHLPLWALIVSSVIAFNGFVPISVQATLKILQQVKGMGGTIIDVIVSDKTGTMTRDRIAIDELVFPPCPSSISPYDHKVAMLETVVMTLEVVQDAAGGGLKCSSQEDTALLSYLQAKHGLHFTTLMPLLRVFTLNVDDVSSKHSFAIRDSIPYVSERARNNHYVFRCGDDNVPIEKPPLLCMKGSRCELTRLCGRDYVDSMPFMGDMDRHASNCKRILFFTRSVVDSERLKQAQEIFDQTERVRALTALEDDILQNREFVFACLGSQDMQDGVTEALQMSRQRGVVFGMCTGDDPRVARSIMLRELEKAGFSSSMESCRCLEGSALLALSPSEVQQFVETSISCGFFCVSNAKPEHKQRVVQVFKSSAFEVCAVGDGANDELMIREAHCGLGIGTDPTADTRVFSDRQIENFSCLAPFLFEQCPRTLSSELTVVHLFLFKGIVIGMSSLLYTWCTGSHTPLVPASAAFTLNNIFITAAVLVFGMFHPSYANGVLLKNPALYRSFGSLSLTTVRRWTAVAFAASIFSVFILLVVFSNEPPALHGVLFVFFTLTMVLCCAVLSIDDASFSSSGNIKLISLFLALHLLLPLVLMFDISGLLFMGGPSPDVLGAMDLMISSHVYTIPVVSCWILTMFLDWFVGFRQRKSKLIHAD